MASSEQQIWAYCEHIGWWNTKRTCKPCMFLASIAAVTSAVEPSMAEVKDG